MKKIIVVCVALTAYLIFQMFSGAKRTEQIRTISSANDEKQIVKIEQNNQQVHQTDTASAEALDSISQSADSNDQMSLSSNDIVAGFMDKINKLYIDYDAKNETEHSSAELILEQNSLDFDAVLGADHPKKNQFLKSLENTLLRKENIDRDFENGIVTQEIFLKELSEIMLQYQAESEQIFTDAEYQKLFSLKKGQNFADALGVSETAVAALGVRDY